MRTLSAVAALLAPVSLPAADVHLRPVSQQPLAHTVLVDRHGTPWFADADGVRGLDNRLVCRPPEKGEPLLVDAAGRVWWKPVYAYGGKLAYFDGKEWVRTAITPDFVHEDAAGRVFAVDSRQVGDSRMTNALHVFAGGKWAVGQLPDRVVAHGRVQALPRFAGDRAGRTWFWLEGYGEWGPTDPAAWAFDGKAWAAHPVAGRTAGESIDRLLPFADDWFLVFASAKDDQHRRHERAFVWSPSRSAEETAKANPFAGLPLGELKYNGTDFDGVRYFHPPHAVGPDRTVTTLTAGELDRATRLALDVPTRRVLGRDKDGRVYVVRGGGMHHELRTWVLWPAKEAADPRLTLTAYPKRQDRPTAYADLFADARGLAFARPVNETDHLLAWDGKAEDWVGTPIRPLPMAHWTARPAPPPEYRWANLRRLGHTAGTDGRTVFVRLKTRYAPEKDAEGPRGGLRSGRPGGAEATDDGPPFYQYEAWTHRDGSWSDPYPPADLFKLKRKELIEGMAVSHTPPGPVPVISHGGRLWYAIDWTVYAMAPDGSVQSAALPKPTPATVADPTRDKPTPPVMLAAFAKADDRSLVLTVSGQETKTFLVQHRAVKPAGVRVEELAPLPASFAVVHKTPDGPVLAWADLRAEARWDQHLPGGRSPTDPRAVYRLRDGKWHQVPDVAPPVAAAADGTVWLPPHAPGLDADAKAGKTVLFRVRGDKPERFVWASDEWEYGAVRASPSGAWLALPRVGLAWVEPGAGGAKPTLRVRPTGPFEGVPPAAPVTTAGGHVLWPSEWGRLAAPAAK